MMLLLGGWGVIGRQLQPLFRERGIEFFAPTHKECELLEQDWDNPCGLYSVLRSYDITSVLSLAAVKTNIFLNKTKPANIAYRTAMMNASLFDMCAEYNINHHLEKVVHIVSSCAYPSGKDLLVESEFFDGNVHESVRPHGESKRFSYMLGQWYRQEFSLPVVALALNNVYGGCDHSHKDTFKVLDALIVKFVDAKLSNAPSVTLFGTGAARREFIYAKDAAEGVLKAYQNYNEEELLNIGSGYDFSIKELAENFVKVLVGYTGEIIWDSSKPDGQINKCFNINKQIDKLGWFPKTSLVDGIDQCINDYYDYLGVKR